ncbi:LysM peptidoglycan-binding domain-containing protein [Candidatus Saccharibacteria bacterium]|nr:LysM peptidoglycan-binding domain-containing protein [Candidatus Saccharibacteria bacterium]
MIVSVLSVNYQSATDSTEVFGVANAQAAAQEEGSIDQVSAAGLAATIAESADISVEANVANLSTSLNARTELAQSNEAYASKPQMVATTERNGVKTYKVKQGDNVQKVASAHRVSVDTLRWANNLTGDSLELGKELTIPTVDGVVYTVKNGDTVENLANKYKASRDRIVSFNDAELSGLRPGQQIVIPGGIVPETERPGYVPPRPTYSYGSFAGSASYTASSFTPVYGNNGYVHGYCTYYVASRISVPRNWGNAATWAYYAKASGWTVSSQPQAGAIAQRGGGLGHVAIVEEVSADGSQIRYSDMNGLAGFNRVGTSGWVPASSYPNYIYR